MPYADLQKNREYNRVWARLNRARRREQAKLWWKKKREERRAAGLCICCGKETLPGKKICGKRRIWSALSEKGLSIEERDRAKSLFAEFKGKCQCCGTDDPGQRAFHLDHKDGKVRGIICGHCNAALGYIRDNPLTAHSLAAYLERTR